MKIRLPPKQKTQFVLLGSGYSLCKISDLIIKNGFKKPIIVTHSKKYHKRDNRILEKFGQHIDIFSYAKKNKLIIYEADDVNDKTLISKLKSKNVNIAFSKGCRSIIKKDFLDSFHNLVFNIHPSILPQERGAATFSWRILNDDKFIAATIHQMDEGIDSGDIILQKKILVKKNKMVPLDYDILTSELYQEIFKKFLGLFVTKKEILLKKQNERYSTYLPRLYTEVNGAINFDWTSKEIEKFVRAFSYPYPGAFTFVRNNKISILECDIEKIDKKLHPFCAGRVNKIYDNGSVRIITKDGYLRINKLLINEKMFKPSEIIKINDVLYTPKDILDNSRGKTIQTKNMK